MRYCILCDGYGEKEVVNKKKSTHPDVIRKQYNVHTRVQIILTHINYIFYEILLKMQLVLHVQTPRIQFRPRRAVYATHTTPACNWLAYSAGANWFHRFLSLCYCILHCVRMRSVKNW